MNRTPINSSLADYPEVFHPIITGARLFDSSCSPEAKVIYIERDCGYYLKSAKKGELASEAELGAYFSSKGLAPKVVEYRSLERDWLLTERAVGEDCTHSRYLDDPKRLCDTLAECLRSLHSLDFDGCPVKDRVSGYLETVRINYREGTYDRSAFPDSFGYRNAEEAYAVVSKYGCELCSDTLIHGDYCLPNVMLDNWKFSAFIDLGNGGVGDRHIDLFWGAWTLWFNLKTNAYRDRFFDAYGRDAVDFERLKTVAACEVFG